MLEIILRVLTSCFSAELLHPVKHADPNNYTGTVEDYLMCVSPFQLTDISPVADIFVEHELEEDVNERISRSCVQLVFVNEALTRHSSTEE